MGFLARLARSTLAVMAFAAAGVAAAAWTAPDPPHPVPPSRLVSATASRLAGLSGETVDVALTLRNPDLRYPVIECTVSFEGFDAEPASCAGKDTATVTVPAGPRDVTVIWQVTDVGPAGDPKAADFMLKTNPDLLTGRFGFTILGAPTATVDPEVAEPGRPIAVTLTSPDQATITSCTVHLGTAAGDCDKDKGIARLTAPADAPRGKELPLSWTFTYSVTLPNPFEHNQSVTDTGSGESGKDHVVPVVPPPPEFDVQPQTRTAAPGLPFVVVFQSRTPGVTFKDCIVTFHGEARCSPSGVVVVDIPPDTRVGDTVTMDWQVFYSSIRPGELPGPVKDQITAKVVVSQPDFVVTVQPGQGEPGDEVTVSLRPVDDDVRILDCMTFFPHGPGAICQRSPERWFTRTVVPPDALPGTALLRWGVTSLTAGERRATPTGGVPFKVVKPPPTDTPSSKPPVDKPPVDKPTTNPPDPTTGPPISTPDTRHPSGQPVFVAMTDPEGADPGQPVSVTIQPLTSGTTITGCRAAFDGTEGATCRPAGGNWTAEVTVPDDAAPGDLPLQWDVTDTGGQGGGGTINYRVLRSGVPPQVLVTLDPIKGKPGGTVKVTPHIDDATVTITGCRAAYLPHGKLAECHNDGQGWVAEVALPDDAPDGSATLFWRVAYARSGDNGATDGNVTIPVEAGPTHWWNKLVGFLWPRGAGVLGLVTALGVAAFQGWRRQRAVQRDRDDDSAAGFSVDVMRQHGAAASTTADGDAPPRLVVRLTLHRGAPYIRGEGLR